MHPILKCNIVMRADASEETLRATFYYVLITVCACVHVSTRHETVRLMERDLYFMCVIRVVCHVTRELRSTGDS